MALSTFARLTIAFSFFVGIVVYTFAFLPAKAKNNTFLNFAAPIKKLPSQIPLFFHSDLYGQYLLIDYIIFQSGHMPAYCDQEKLIKITSTSSPFVALLPKVHFDELSLNDKSKFTVLEKETISWLLISPGGIN